MIPALILAAAAFAAGKPITVACDAAQVAPPPPPGFVVEGWTPYGGDTIHLNEARCADLSAAPGTLPFARGLRIVIHESEHARGVRAEDCAELWAVYGVYSVLNDIYGIKYTDRRGWAIAAQVRAESMRRPASYRPGPSTCVGEP